MQTEDYKLEQKFLKVVSLLDVMFSRTHHFEQVPVSFRFISTPYTLKRRAFLRLSSIEFIYHCLREAVDPCLRKKTVQVHLRVRLNVPGRVAAIPITHMLPAVNESRGSDVSALGFTPQRLSFAWFPTLHHM
jgi:hypothetical protein